MLGATEQPAATANKHIIPVQIARLKMISMGLPESRRQADDLRGPMLHSVITQFLRSVEWASWII